MLAATHALTAPVRATGVWTVLSGAYLCHEQFRADAIGAGDEQRVHIAARPYDSQPIRIRARPRARARFKTASATRSSTAVALGVGPASQPA